MIYRGDRISRDNNDSLIRLPKYKLSNTRDRRRFP